MSTKSQPMGADITPAAGKDIHYSTEPSRFKNRGRLLLKNKLVLANFTSAASAEDLTFIVTACNSHAALVEALEEIAKDKAAQGNGMVISRPAQIARAALALAKGGTQ